MVRNPAYANWLLAVGVILFVAVNAQAQRPKPKETIIDGHTMYTLMEPGGIPAIFDPEFMPVADADSFFYDEEPMLAISVGDEVKAYSTWHLDHHEIVNDWIGGKAIAATW